MVDALTEGGARCHLVKSHSEDLIKFRETQQDHGFTDAEMLRESCMPGSL